MNEDLRRLIADIAQEIDGEDVARRSPEEAHMHQFCQHLLLIERDLRAPGSARSQEDRVTIILTELANAKLS